ncbi:hypothetical protein ACQPUQ_09755 [Clostridium paraputrificum]|uniref:hypothetical protein n=2 Tax=Clostridiaceae TaxID=31979 RepID=UPI003D349D96
MDLEKSFYIIEGVLKEYSDSRIYQRYCFDNLLLQITGENLSYKEYKEKIGLDNKSTNIKENNKAIKEEDIKNRKDNASKLLASFLNEKK